MRIENEFWNRLHGLQEGLHGLGGNELTRIRNEFKRSSDKLISCFILLFVSFFCFQDHNQSVFFGLDQFAIYPYLKGSLLHRKHL